MKKIALIFVLALAILPITTACDQTDKYLSAVSELTTNVYCGENETYAVTALTGKREDPYLSDGVKEETYPFFNLTVRVKGDVSSGEEFAASATVHGETYAVDLRFSPLGDKLTGSFAVKQPVTEGTVMLTLFRGGESQTITLTGEEGLCPYESVLSLAVNALGTDVTKHLYKGVFAGEIHVRLSRVQSVTYWFVTFIPKDGEACSVLADAHTGEVLAVKGVTPSLTPSVAPSAI